MSDKIVGWMYKAAGQLDDARLTALKKAAANTRTLGPTNTLKFVANFFAPLPADRFADVLAHLRKSDSVLGSTGDGASKDVQYLVGGAIEQALDRGDSDHAAILSLAVVVGSLVGTRSGEFLAEIPIYANESFPAIRAGYISGKDGSESAKAIAASVEGVKDINTDVPNAAKAIQAVLKQMRGEYVDRVTDLARKVRIAEEEREYLWRHVTRFSDIANCTYNELAFEAEPCLVGVDYAVKGGFPIPPPVVRLLMKMSLEAREGAKDHARVTLKSSVMAIPADILRKLSADFDVHRYESSFPVLAAISSASNTTGDAWTGAYKSNTGIDAGAELTRPDLAYQTLLEVQLHRLALAKQA